MEYQEKVLKCVDCGTEFLFTIREQQFYAEKGFRNEPKRCRDCKATRAQGGGNSMGGATRVDTHRVFPVWEGDLCPLQAHAGTPGVLPRLLPGTP